MRPDGEVPDEEELVNDSEEIVSKGLRRTLRRSTAANLTGRR